MIEAYPLYWPEGWPRTKHYDRGPSRFNNTFACARDELLHEVLLLRGRYSYLSDDPILSTNVALRRDGLPLASQKRVEDPGVAIYFKYKKKGMVFACDKYVTVWENMVAIKKTIEAIRGIERWGASDMMERAFRGFLALPDGNNQPWHEVLGVSPDADRVTIDEAYRRLRSQNHPDRGGSAEQFNRIQKAYQEVVQ